MQLLTRFLEFVQSNRLIRPGERCLTAVSGGLDSMTLAALMLEAGLEFGLAHCNFQLRGAESDGDADFVRAWAQEHNLPFFETCFETEKYAEENKISIQMAARNLRYDWFEQIRREHEYDCILTAHHRNDSVETALLNWSRGTGLEGLTGIPRSNGRVVRPLLFATRAELAEYAAQKDLRWREDGSNASDDYARNAVRRHIVPEFEKLNPEFLSVSARNMQRLQEQADNLAWLTKFYIGEDGFRLPKEKLAPLPAPARFLHEWLKSYGFSPEQARQMAENADKVGMEWSSAQGYRLLSDRTHWLLAPPEAETPQALVIAEDDLMVTLPDRKRLFLTSVGPETPFPDGKTAVLVDADRLQYPLRLRHWQPGDAFQPLGMEGKSRKLQDFFTDLKLSVFEKERVWVLENGDGRLIWILGYRPDERFKIVKNTVKSLKISVVDLN